MSGLIKETERTDSINWRNRKMRTLGQAFQMPHNHFTALRLAAAVAVLYYHCYPLASGSGSHDPLSVMLWKGAGIGLGGLAVGAFFAISGFLVTASFAHRQNLFAFIEARALRIFPGLIVALLFCVLVVGPLATSLPLTEYLSNELTWRFLAKNVTLVTGLQFSLPGVFKATPWVNAVNGSLWTLPVEIWMYMWVAIIGALGLLKERPLFNGVVFVSALVYLVSPETFPITRVDGSVRNPLFFVIGAFFYVNRDFIPLNWPMLIGATLVLALLPKGSAGVMLTTLYITYVIFFLTFSPRLNTKAVDRVGDLSYGAYIYAFPVQQLVAYYVDKVSPLGMFIISLPTVLMLAYVSWRLVEKPALGFKGRIPMGRRYLDPRVLNGRVIP